MCNVAPSGIMVSMPRPLPTSPVLRVALVCLVALAGASVALPLVTAHGIGLALAKLAVLAFVGARLWRVDVYTLQWSSMLVLLFIAEGIVRAMTDPGPGAVCGALALASGGGYFVAVLAYLRPLKRAARGGGP